MADIFEFQPPLFVYVLFEIKIETQYVDYKIQVMFGFGKQERKKILKKMVFLYLIFYRISYKRKSNIIKIN